MKIVHIDVSRYKLPLKKPYALSLGRIDEFDVIMVVVQTPNNHYLGDVTSLPGYAQDSQEEICEYLVQTSKKLIGQNTENAFEFVQTHWKAGSLKTSPLLMALETSFSKESHDHSAFDIPLVALLDLSGDLERQLEAYDERTRQLKIKIGINIHSELKALRQLRRIPLIQKFEIRVDANQGLTESQALDFNEGFEGLPIILLEQPFKTQAWKSVEWLCKKIDLPIMLDESICSLDDIRRASDCGAEWIKIKLAKFGSRRAVKACIDLAKELRLKVIIGNGVATEITCYYEALSWQQEGLQFAGEMNGFLKLKFPTIKKPFKSQQALWNCKSQDLELDKGCLEQYRIMGSLIS